MVKLLKFGKGSVISSHTLLDLSLLGKLIHVIKRGPGAIFHKSINIIWIHHFTGIDMTLTCLSFSLVVAAAEASTITMTSVAVPLTLAAVVPLDSEAVVHLQQLQMMTIGISPSPLQEHHWRWMTWFTFKVIYHAELYSEACSWT